MAIKYIHIVLSLYISWSVQLVSYLPDAPDEAWVGEARRACATRSRMTALGCEKDFVGYEQRFVGYAQRFVDLSVYSYDT